MTQQSGCFVKFDGAILGPMSLDEVYDAWIHHDFRDTDQILHRSKLPQWTELKALFRKSEFPPTPSLAEQIALPPPWLDYLRVQEEKTAIALLAQEKSAQQESNSSISNEEIPEEAIGFDEVSITSTVPIPQAVTLKNEPSEKARLLMESLQVPDFEELGEWLESLNTKNRTSGGLKSAAAAPSKEISKQIAAKKSSVQEERLEQAPKHVIYERLPGLEPLQTPIKPGPRKPVRTVALAFVALVAFGSLLGIIYLQWNQKGLDAGSNASMINRDNETTKAESPPPLRSPTKPRRE